MKKLLFFVVVFLLCVSCDKQYTYYALVKRTDYSLNSNGVEDNDLEVFAARSLEEAYTTAYRKYRISMETSDAFRSSVLNRKVTGFDLLNEKKESVIHLLDAKKRDSIEMVVNPLTENLGTNMENKIAAASKNNNTSKIDSATVKKLKPLFKENKDEFSTYSWVQPVAKPTYINQNAIYCYFSKEDGIVDNFRLKIQYASDDWLFIQSVKFNIDGEIFEYNPEWERDNNSGIWEWSDEQVRPRDVTLVRAIAEAKSVKYRLVGRQYNKDKVLSAKYIQSIKNTLRYYEALGGTFN